MYLFIESAIRGGVSMIAHRHAVANNGVGSDITKPASYLAYWDANNLYGWAMSQSLPTGRFRWLDEAEVESFTSDKIVNIADDDDTGYFFEVDLEYPDHLHHLHNSLPLAPEKVTVDKDMYSPYAESFDKDFVPSEKLIPMLSNKSNYVTHYRNLKFYIEHGLKVTKIHRILSFSQSFWMRNYIELNTENRKRAVDEFEKDFFKLMNNAVFGKTIENVRHRIEIKMVTKENRLKKLAAKPNCKFSIRVNNDLVMVNMGSRN